MSKGNPQGLVNHLLELNWRSNIGTDSLHVDFYIYMLKQKAVFCSVLSLWGQQGSCGKCYGVIKSKTGKFCPWRKPPYFIIILFQIFFFQIFFFPYFLFSQGKVCSALTVHMQHKMLQNQTMNSGWVHLFQWFSWQSFSACISFSTSSHIWVE